MRYIFFSLRDFKIDVGESVRIYGILNSLASEGHQVVFISNAASYSMFHPLIKHVCIDFEFKEKRAMQAMLAVLPSRFVFWKYKMLFVKIGDALRLAHVGNETVFFFDYLDNSIGYILKRRGLIGGYINDVHGIATIEFLNHIKNAKTFYNKLIYWFKYRFAYRLDKKVFESADGFIYGSDKMRGYYEGLYQLRGKRNYVIPYVLGEEAVNRKVDERLKADLLKELEISPADFVFLFVGTYKPTAGVDDLIRAFDGLLKRFSRCKLILIGNGPLKDECLQLAGELSSRSQVKFIDKIPYSELLTYQSLANVIVCPDKSNLYSNYVVHVKYFDALISGRLVINGAFDSVREVNQDDFLSLTFEPSNVNHLQERLEFCKINYDALKKQYKDTRDYTASHLTYRLFIRELTKFEKLSE
jgi:glycosyltransferase involved in cell wall biosynthesis